MKNNNMTTFIIVAGVLILCVFSSILGLNMLPNYESDSYYVKIEEEMNAKIESIIIENTLVKVYTSGEASKYCVKTTKTTPDINNICWKQIDNNQAEFTIYKNRKYYIWIMDEENNISEPRNFTSKSTEIK